MSEPETVTVYLWDDEWYPVYSVDDDGTSVRHFASKVDVPRVLRLAGVLTVDEHTVNTDTHGGNAGKWLNTFCADLAPTGAHPNPTVYLMECAP